MASYRQQGPVERFDKRKLPRFPVQLPVELGHKANDFSSICTNLSEKGLSVETALRLGIGERLAVAVTLAPKEEPLRMVGQVVWMRNLNAKDSDDHEIREFGIRFLRPLPTAQPLRDEGDRDFDPLSGPSGDEIPDISFIGRP